MVYLKGWKSDRKTGGARKWALSRQQAHSLVWKSDAILIDRWGIRKKTFFTPLVYAPGGLKNGWIRRPVGVYKKTFCERVHPARYKKWWYNHRPAAVPLFYSAGVTRIFGKEKQIMSFENWNAFVERTKAELIKDRENKNEKGQKTRRKQEKKRKPAATRQTGSLDRMN